MKPFGKIWYFRLSRLLEELGKGLEDGGLAKYAFETRYPGPIEPVTEEEYREALRLAKAVVAWAEEVITRAS
jgi:HEPN domain-containing protein